MPSDLTFAFVSVCMLHKWTINACHSDRVTCIPPRALIYIYTHIDEWRIHNTHIKYINMLPLLFGLKLQRACYSQPHIHLCVCKWIHACIYRYRVYRLAHFSATIQADDINSTVTMDTNYHVCECVCGCLCRLRSTFIFFIFICVFLFLFRSLLLFALLFLFSSVVVIAIAAIFHQKKKFHVISRRKKKHFSLKIFHLLQIF